MKYFKLALLLPFSTHLFAADITIDKDIDPNKGFDLTVETKKTETTLSFVDDKGTQLIIPPFSVLKIDSTKTGFNITNADESQQLILIGDITADVYNNYNFMGDKKEFKAGKHVLANADFKSIDYTPALPDAEFTPHYDDGNLCLSVPKEVETNNEFMTTPYHQKITFFGYAKVTITADGTSKDKLLRFIKENTRVIYAIDNKEKITPLPVTEFKYEVVPQADAKTDETQKTTTYRYKIVVPVEKYMDRYYFALKENSFDGQYSDKYRVTLNNVTAYCQ